MKLPNNESLLDIKAASTHILKKKKKKKKKKMEGRGFTPNFKYCIILVMTMNRHRFDQGHIS